eukprot:ANDGO_06559.mRNA.1 Katanin p60 ATPase-containing subunit A1
MSDRENLHSHMAYEAGLQRAIYDSIKSSSAGARTTYPSSSSSTQNRFSSSAVHRTVLPHASAWNSQPLARRNADWKLQPTVPSSRMSIHSSSSTSPAATASNANSKSKCKLSEGSKGVHAAGISKRSASVVDLRTSSSVKPQMQRAHQQHLQKQDAQEPALPSPALAPSSSSSSSSSTTTTTTTVATAPGRGTGGKVGSSAKALDVSNSTAAMRAQLTERLQRSGALDNLPPDYQKFVDVILSEIVLTSPGVQWAGIVGQGSAKQALQEAVVMPLLAPQLFRGIRRPWRGVLLYGPPGTGKTMLAKAVVSETSATFFNISAATVTSKWYGESEKIVRVLFSIARALAPSIVFVDEMDSIFHDRESASSNHDANRRVSTAFLAEIDGLCSQSAEPVGDENTVGVAVIGTTNKPWDIGAAMLRRLEQRIYVPPPDSNGRKDLFKACLADSHDITLDVSSFLPAGEFATAYDAFAAKTDGYSAADIVIVCREAAMLPMRRFSSGKSIDELKLLLASSQAKELSVIHVNDVFAAIQSVRPTDSQTAVQRFEKWKQMCGTDN